MFDKICNWLRSRGVCPDAQDALLLRQHSSAMGIPRGRVIMPQGRPVDHLYFLNSGIVRLFRLHEGRDMTLDFISAGEFVSTAVYVLNRQPSPCGLETMTDIGGLIWNRGDLLTFQREVSVAGQIEQALLDRLLNWNQEREMDVMSLTPEARYEKLLRLSPQVVQQVPQRYIASFLGIHADSLSRIRAKLSRKRS